MPKSKRSAKRRKKVKFKNGKVVVKNPYIGLTIKQEVVNALAIINDPEADFDERMKLRDQYFNQNEVKPEHLTLKSKYSH